MERKFPPGPNAAFLVANALEFARNPLNFLLKCTQIYGDVVHFAIQNQHYYLVNNPEYVYEILVQQTDKFKKPPFFNELLGNLSGVSLLTMNGELHRQRRRLMQPAFHHQRINDYTATMVQHTSQMVECWNANQTYNMADEMMLLSMNIVAETLFGANALNEGYAVGQALIEFMDYYVHQIMLPVRIPAWIPLKRHTRARKATETIDKTMMKIIETRRAAAEDTGDLLSMLLMSIDEDTGERLTNQEIRDEAAILFSVGYETTALALTWTLYLLAEHPEADAHLAEELNNVLQGRLPTIKDLPDLKYTAMVLKEAMRLYPPAWAFGRQAIQDIQVGDYTVVKDAFVVLCPFIMHRNPNYFEQPLEFNPERFADGYEKRMPRYAYFPFGGGAHMCIGATFATVQSVLSLATIAQKYRFTLEPNSKVEIEPLITIRPKYGLFLRTIARDKRLTPVPDLAVE